MSGKQSLVIVESPTKARTIGKYLGPGYTVKASVGHVRDLPKRELGVDVNGGFEPRYVTIRGKGKILSELSRAAERANRVLLATDPDREGEAIAYHVAQELGWNPAADDGRFARVRFHEVTKAAIQKALEESAGLDLRKVDAQQARRLLDRLVGYEASPLLWKPIRPGLSAGRVQTVALRLIAEREDEIRDFEPREYWSVTARLRAGGKEFEAKLHKVGGARPRLPTEASAAAVLQDLEGAEFVVGGVTRRQRKKAPPPPFTTSTLQQEAAKRLGFSARRTMRVAQQLYEGVDLPGGAEGLITYMRTDSTRVSGGAVAAARRHLKAKLGAEYLPRSPRLWGSRKQKGAQEAHEAIRPTDPTRTPSRVRSYLKRDQHRLYELIWLRFMAGQLRHAVYDTTTLDFPLKRASTDYLFRASGSVLTFDGYTRLYQESRDVGEKGGDLPPLPPMEEGDRAERVRLVPAQHFTKPPARFTEAGLVKELEKLGIGRPSTYAQIISTLRDRKYVGTEKKRFVPTPLGETVAKVLVRLFPDVFDVRFTSGMEEELDRIEAGELEWRAVLGRFYGSFHERVEEGRRNGADVLRSVMAVPDEECPECGSELAVRWNKYGRFVGCTGYPDCRFTRSLDDEARPEPEAVGETCPECGGELLQRTGRYGAFIGCGNHPKCRFTRPVTVPGLDCPKCGEGGVGEKRTRRGKTFWGCIRYPECDWSSWDRPIGTPCPTCGAAYLVAKTSRSRGTFYKCASCKSEMAPATVEAEAEETG